MELPATFIASAILVAAIGLLLGLALGWWLRGRRTRTDGQLPDDGPESALVALARLHEVAKRVADDVGEHSSRMQTISRELQSVQPAGAESPNDAVLAVAAQIVEANQRLQEQLKSAERKLHGQARQIELHAADALTDALTRGGNRRAFDAELARNLSEWNRRGTPFCLIMLDVDHFKMFNDTRGHQAGDNVLRGVANSLRDTLRDMDLVARYGGEEFAVILPGTPLDQGEAAARRIGPTIAGCRFEFEGQAFDVTVSGGLAQALPNEEAAQLIQRADEALYAAKAAGRNRVYLHDGQTTRLIAPQATGDPAPHRATDPEADVAEQNLAGPNPVIARNADSQAASARIDTQTGLANRAAFREVVRRRLAESQRFGTTLSLMLLRVDHLREVMEQHGPRTVELVPRTVAQFLTAAVREMDLLARYDRDVFAILLPGTPLGPAAESAERLRSAAEQSPLRGKDLELRITLSVGVAESLRSEDVVSLIRRTEGAMGASVAAGQDCTHVHTGSAIEPVGEKGTFRPST